MMNFLSRFLLFVFICCSLSLMASEPKKMILEKSKLNTQIYEPEPTTETFAAIVKVVREIQGEQQVFFEKRQGFYVIKNELHQQKLVKSMEKKKEVNVEADIDSRIILQVEFKD